MGVQQVMHITLVMDAHVHGIKGNIIIKSATMLILSVPILLGTLNCIVLKANLASFLLLMRRALLSAWT